MVRGEHLALVDRGGTYLQIPAPTQHPLFFKQERFSFDLQLELFAVLLHINHTEAGLISATHIVKLYLS